VLFTEWNCYVCVSLWLQAEYRIEYHLFLQREFDPSTTSLLGLHCIMQYHANVLDVNANVSGGEAKCRAGPPLKTHNQFGYRFKYITIRLSSEAMCKIWFWSIQPLRICACVTKCFSACGFTLAASGGKRIVTVWYLSVCLSRQHTVTQQWAACNAASVHFDSTIRTDWHYFVMYPSVSLSEQLQVNFWGVNRRFQARHLKYYNLHIVKTIAVDLLYRFWPIFKLKIRC